MPKDAETTELLLKYFAYCSPVLSERQALEPDKQRKCAAVMDEMQKRRQGR